MFSQSWSSEDEEELISSFESLKKYEFDGDNESDTTRVGTYEAINKTITKTPDLDKYLFDGDREEISVDFGTTITETPDLNKYLFDGDCEEISVGFGTTITKTPDLDKYLFDGDCEEISVGFGCRSSPPNSGSSEASTGRTTTTTKRKKKYDPIFPKFVLPIQTKRPKPTLFANDGRTPSSTDTKSSGASVPVGKNPRKERRVNKTGGSGIVRNKHRTRMLTRDSCVASLSLECQCGGQCADKFRVEDVQKFRNEIWNNSDYAQVTASIVRKLEREGLLISEEDSASGEADFKFRFFIEGKKVSGYCRFQWGVWSR
jgi:hypothetical protein